MSQLCSLLRATHSRWLSWVFIWNPGVLFQVHSVLSSSRPEVPPFLLAARDYSQLLETTLRSLPCTSLIFTASIREFPLCQILIMCQIFQQEEPSPFYGLTDELRLGHLWHVIWPMYRSDIPTYPQVLPTLKGKGLCKSVGHCGHFSILPTPTLNE